ncbi:5'/3'-nucleotidase SurE [Kaistia dalseonensis]|uniref:5'-nucleotidase SurE n=1 Tax=Kaistia dalseonensis TaxID=410840 RepID=A0ABU0H1H2_9HYPH|nr:5'/3'-nucleotidase SurE [Kaistia dalseonensis]MCX5493601.1 5'/3'-nucleotidase SurE [Kaistia dalseonensis]MDQ0436162.1 5'-nucleotidase [Kaistia dalseonensis]
MRILITNDDGIHAPGLEVLHRIARTLSDDVWIVAPETDQSGLAHSLTMNDPLRLRQVDEQAFAVRGTPTDCVIMAVRKVIGEKPDLILSGVNAGKNAGDDVLYSGTVAAAIEGTLLGIPSIAVSQAFQRIDGRKEIPWETAEALAPDILRKLIAHGCPHGILYNVNFPTVPVDQVVGIKVAPQAAVGHGLTIDERLDGRSNPYFWLKYQRPVEEIAVGSDVEALSKGFVTVTPLRLDMTAHDEVAALSTLFG